MAEQNPAAGPPGHEGLFSERPLPAAPQDTPDQGLFSERPLRSPHESGASPGKSPMRLAVPLALFVLVIGGIAWLVQNMPSWRGRPQADPTPAEGGQIALLRFIHPHNRGVYLALWEPMPEEKVAGDKQFYAREFERDADGQYYFPLALMGDAAVELGVSRKSCDCSLLHVAVLPEEEWKELSKAIWKEPGHTVVEKPHWDWKPLEKTEERGVMMPVNGYAVVRMSWHNKRGPGDSLNLGANVWARAAGTTRKQEYGLRIDAVSTHPLRAKRDRIDVGGILPGAHGTAEFTVWSPTRDQVQFRFAAPDPLFEMTVKQLAPAECAELQAKLRAENINTRVRAAWTVTVQVHEQKGKLQLDQGYFQRVIQADVGDDVPPLVVTGTVRSEFTIGAEKDRGKINLGSFPAVRGTKTRIFISTQTGSELDLGKVEHPAGVKVQLVESAKRKWELHVEVPPHRFFGPIGDDNVVILRTKSGRPIRVPLMGNAVQG